eukprot:Amastigsp_a847844_22.p2 type:complete len:256 gc:universal Amastigsp_a847844_22:790-23(-)
MAFFVAQTEFDKARAVAARAVKTILYTEEREKLNVYTAWLNLEHAHGSERSLREVFVKAVQVNDSFKVHSALLDIYEAAGALRDAGELHDRCCKLFGRENVTVWVRAAAHALRTKAASGTKQVLARALQALPRAKHLNVIAKFAQLEFKSGHAERGRTLLDELLATKPKRVDIWGIYIDLELAHGDVARTRRLFERVTALSGLSVQKMKSLFARHLEFETEHGDARTQAAVKDRARAFIERKLAARASAADADNE